MKRLIVLFIVAVFGITLMGCNMESYTAGRFSYYMMEENLSPETIDRLENRWNRLLDETSGVVMVEPDQIKTMFMDMSLIIALEVENPYGILGDITYLFSESGAEYSPTGEMTYIRPMKRQTFVAFSQGWKNSKYELAGR